MDIRQILKQRRQQRLKDKFTVKTYTDTWRGLRVASSPTTFIIQVVTACLAITLPAFAIKILFDSRIVGFAVGAVLIFGFEYFKRIIVDNVSTGFFNKGRVSVIGIFLVAIMLSASVLMSCFSVPILVSEFAPMPVKPVESEVFSQYDSLEAATVAHWSNLKQEHLSKAKEIHAQSNWKGVTTRDARKVKLGYENAAKAAQDSLNNAMAAIAIKKESAFSASLSEYEQEKSKRQRQKTGVGIALGFVTLVFELLFILLTTWSNYYDFSEACESGLITFESSKSSRESTIIPIKVDDEADEAGGKPGPRTGIGFTSEGKVIKDDGKLKIWCRKSNGELKLYDSAYLSTLIGQSRGKDRHSYWVEMKNKLNRTKKAY